MRKPFSLVSFYWYPPIPIRPECVPLAYRCELKLVAVELLALRRPGHPKYRFLRLVNLKYDGFR